MKRDMKRLKQTYVLQDRLTKQPKMYKTLTEEESWDANALLRSFGSTSQWVQTVHAIVIPGETPKGQVA